MENKPKFGEFLVANKLMKREEIQDCLAQQKDLANTIVGNQLGNIILMYKFMDEDTLVKYTNIYNQKYSATGFKKDAQYFAILNLMPSDSIMSKITSTVYSNMVSDNMIPLSITGNEVKVIVTAKTNLTRIEAYKAPLGLPSIYKPIFIYCFEHSMLTKLKQIGSLLKLDTQEVDSMTKEINLHENLISVFREGAKQKCSDIIITNNSKYVIVKFRFTTRGKIFDDKFLKAEQIENIARHILDLAGKPDTELTKLAVDCQINSLLGEYDKSWSARVSIVKTILGYKINLRLIPRDEKPLNLTELKFDLNTQKYICDHKDSKAGLFYIAGHMGSGKNTTAYAIMDTWDTEQFDIVTIEQPVERPNENIPQVEISDGLDIPTILRTVLRQSLDKVFVGETRDAETLELSVTNAIAGMFIMSTIHIDRTAQIWSRIHSLDPSLLPKFITALNGIITQILVNALCDNCKQETTYDELDEVDKIYLDSVVLYKLNRETGKSTSYKYNGKLYKACGCAKCNNSGYKGVVVLTEVLPYTPSIKRQIASINDFSKLEYVTDKLLEDNELSFKYSASRMLNKGIIDVATARIGQLMDFTYDK